MNHEVRILFHELIELTPLERERILQERRIATELRAEVESLLKFDAAEADVLTRLVSSAARDVLRPAEPETTHCGPYRLVRLLGSGGMGAVYLAERSDGQIQHQVAVKFLRADIYRPAWRERFLRERQLLASLNHPSIVHLIDAGQTAEGRPYLIMEYVDGVPIDAYVEGLAVRERLRLFLRLCEGVSHAHRRLVIHRDLKPSNILVDASGQPKVLDFGIAKLVDEPDDATRTVERLMTPSYASPEQISGEAQTTATDVYSLGAVLYKLLAGVAPRQSASRTGVSRIPPPSRFNAEVTRDVDSIVLKSLRPEPEERYVSVDEFANDIRAALDWRPVQARFGDPWYRTRRFLRRQWVTVTASALVICSLSLGLYVSNRQRAIAERRFVEVRQLANKLFDIDVQVAQLPGASKTRQMIVDTALEYLQRVTAGVRMAPDLSLEVGSAYMRVARVQGVNISANLGQTERADQTEQKAEAMIDGVLRSQPRNRAALLRAAQIAHDRMILAGDARRDDEALKFAATSLQRMEQYLQTGRLDATSDRLEAQQAIITYINVANRYMRADRFDDAIRIAGQAIEIAQATNWPTQAGAALMIVAFARRGRGELEEALQAIRESVRVLEPPDGEKRAGRLLSFALALTREGQILGEARAISLNRSAEAVECFERALAISESFARNDPSDFSSQHRVFLTETKMAAILSDAEPHRALELFTDALQRLQHVKDHASTPLNEIETLAASTYPLRRLGRAVEARKRLDAAFSRLQGLHLYPAKRVELGSETDHSLRALAEYEAGIGNVQRAAEVYGELLDKAFAGEPRPETKLADATQLSGLYQAAATNRRRAGQIDRAELLETRRLQLWQRWASKFPDNAYVRRQLAAARLP